jgi:hypothetical protein
VTLANPAVPPGKYNGVRIIEVRHVPPDVSDEEVRWFYANTVDISGAHVREYRKIGNEGRILY